MGNFLVSDVKTVIFSYLQLSNVGCEIIFRGTMAFLERAFPDHKLNFILCSYHVDRDRALLSDVDSVQVIPMVGWKRYWRGVLVKTGLDKVFWSPRFSSKYFRNADLFASVGGDIYTMSGNDLPHDWLGWERYATRRGIPSIMFGANMEKFEVLCESERKDLLAHLKRFRFMAVRDVATVEYLKGHGVSENTVFFPDPIFSLRPTCRFSRDEIKTIGLNVSPILLRDFGEGVFERIANIVEELVSKGFRFKLIPHVYSSEGNPKLHDPLALRQLYELLPEATQSSVDLYEGSMSLADMAREIESVDMFVGARMHGCLNAVTLGKPTYFLAYSKKAQTMVSWLQNGPLKELSDRVAFGSAENVTSDNILAVINSHEGARLGEMHDVDFGTGLKGTAVGRKLEQAALFK